MAITINGNNLMTLSVVGDEFADKIRIGGFIAVTTTNSGVVQAKNSNDEVVFDSGAMNAQESKSEDGVGWTDGVKVTSLPVGAILIVQFH